MVYYLCEILIIAGKSNRVLPGNQVLLFVWVLVYLMGTYNPVYYMYIDSEIVDFLLHANELVD